MCSVSNLDLLESKLSTSVLFKGSFKSSSSSEDTSLDVEEVLEENNKKVLHAQGLYDPGSEEVCAKYLVISRSSVIQHPYYAYPAVKDPGIVDALLRTEADKVFDDNGQELYLHLCEEMNLAPIRMFHRGLLQDVIDLRYYGINPKAVRTICLALANNKNVQRLDLTGNFFNYDDDACYHLGEMLGQRNAIHDLVLDGCRIGPRGLQFLAVHLDIRKMNVLDLSGNEIRDKGFQFLLEKLERGGVIKKLNLSDNNLSSDSAKMLVQILAFNNCLTHLDFSRNKFLTPRGVAILIRSLSDSVVLEELNLAWTSLKLSGELAPLFHIRTLKVLNLSNNRLGTDAAHTIAGHLPFTNLITLDLSSNPFKPEDALKIMRKLKFRRVPVKELFMNYIVVDKIFATELKQISAMPHRHGSVVTHGEVLRGYEALAEVDIKIIAMKRFATVYQSKKKPDIMVYFLIRKQTGDILNVNDLIGDMLLMGHKVNMESVDSLLKYFPAKPPPKSKEKGRFISLIGITDYIRRLWPDKQIPVEEPEKPKKKKSPTKKGKKAK